MATPFDAATKHLIEAHPADWLALAGLHPNGPVELVDADVATISAAADKVVLVREPQPWLAHLEMQASYDADLPERALFYNVLLQHRHRMPVVSAAVLLRPEADGRAMTGLVRHNAPDGSRTLEFEYRLVRIWQEPVEELLTGGIGTLPLAPLADIHGADVAEVVQTIERRLDQDASPEEDASLRAASYILMGLRYAPEVTHAVWKGVRNMEESSTYQEIIRKGRAQGYFEASQQMLRELGTKRFGEPDETTKRVLDRITSVRRLQTLATRVMDVESWADLLASP